MHVRDSLSPFPHGWFLVCYSHELPRGKLFSKTFMGREIIAFRGADGQVCVADAFCPHLGAHMGKGGCIEGDAVRCPFHGFRFDQTGRCVSTPYSDPPKAARLTRWPVQEVNGFILAYFDSEGRSPTWRVPELDERGWGPLTTKHYRLRGHPQETTENGVDIAHLSVVHGYRQVEVVDPVRVDGPLLTGAYRMRRSAGPLELLGVRLAPEFRVQVWGLGYSLIETEVAKYGMHGRQWTFATPSDGTFIDLHIALRLRELAHPEAILPGLQYVPQQLMMRAAQAFFMRAYEHDIEQDFEIWQNKQHLQRPALARNDGPIGLYRRYCRQFYPRPQASAQHGDGSAAETGASPTESRPLDLVALTRPAR